MEPSPRRRVDWLYAILGTLIALGAGAMMASVSGGLSELREDVGGLRVDVAQLQIEIRMGMVDRFTGKEGATLRRQIDELNKSDAGLEGRLDAVERFCSIVGSRDHPRLNLP